MRLLLAEDEKEMANAIRAVLIHNHYGVDVVSNGNDALDYARGADYDGVILDIMMPGRSGLEVLEILRREGSSVPIMLLTAKGEIDDRVAGLDLGADDYLTKPFAMKELLARIRAMTRRRAETVTKTLKFHGLCLNCETCELCYAEASSHLGGKEYQMMEMLMRNPGVLISAEQFMEKVWGFDTEVEVNAVWVYLSYLRRKLQTLRAPVAIRAVRGVGYRLEVEEE